MRKELTATEIKSIKREGIYRAGPTLPEIHLTGGAIYWEPLKAEIAYQEFEPHSSPLKLQKMMRKI